MFKLVISDDEGKSTVVPLVRDAITIGRKEGNTIRLTERNVSRRHARLTKSNGSLTVEDLQSYNGVKVNGKKVETPLSLKAGDKITIGDYNLALQIDQPEVTTAPDVRLPQTATEVTALIDVPVDYAPPARLVMLSPPAPGAEFALSRPLLRIGRAEDLDVWINHRSISREHAEVRRTDGPSGSPTDATFHIKDLGSANGMRINGKDLGEAVLKPGDMLELGQVRFRFVGEGEAYTFDADRTVQMEPLSGGAPQRSPWTVAVVIILGCVGVGALAALGGWPLGTSSTDETVLPRAVEPGPAVAVAPTAPSDDAEERTVAEAVRHCEEALSGGRYAEAISFGGAALGLRPGHGAASQCLTQARAAQSEALVFERGRSLLSQGNVDGAYLAFAELSAESPLRQNPDVMSATTQYAERHLGLARRAVASDPATAVREADTVLTVEGLPTKTRDAAQFLRQRALARRRAAEPRVVAAAQEAAPTEGAGAPRETEPRETPLQQARACLLNGDQQCVIRALEGKARSCAEVATLIEAYKEVSNMSAAQRHMRTFIERCPTHPLFQHYRQLLARLGG